jgi:hypothetical protein
VDVDAADAVRTVPSAARSRARPPGTPPQSAGMNVATNLREPVINLRNHTQNGNAIKAAIGRDRIRMTVRCPSAWAITSLSFC